MVTISLNTISRKFNIILNSIPCHPLDLLGENLKENFISFAKTTGIPTDSDLLMRKLASLLLLNRLRFINVNNIAHEFLKLTMMETNEKLKNMYPDVFIYSIIEEIANLSNLNISLSLVEFHLEFLKNSVELLSSIYLNIIDQRYRRKTGQFWTPNNVSELMVSLALENNPKNLLDPCTGPGTFLNTIKEKFSLFSGNITSFEIHPVLYELATVNLYQALFSKKILFNNFLTIGNKRINSRITNSLAFINHPNLYSYFQKKNTGGFDSIICNPPYSRHHVISNRLKDVIGQEIEESFGGKFNRISSLFMYFILKCLKLLANNGRMVFLTPTIAFESRNSEYLKGILKSRFLIPYIIVFDGSLNIFPGVDTAACIFIIEAKKPTSSSKTRLLMLNKLLPPAKILKLLKFNTNDKTQDFSGELYLKRQLELNPANNWTSPTPFLNVKHHKKLIKLSHYFKVMRGIATGNNAFFTFTDEDIKELEIEKFVVPTITKTRHIQKFILTQNDINQLKNDKKRVWLLNLQKTKEEINNKALNNYLNSGLESRVNEGSLVKTRKFWYFTEKRNIPTFIFTYLSRGSPRFILNEAGVRPLNTFLMLYPKEKRIAHVKDIVLFWVILNSSYTFRELRNVGRGYGGETLKIEPREMDNVLILNPFRISPESKRKLNDLAEELRQVTTLTKSSIINAIDLIIKNELSSI